MSIITRLKESKIGEIWLKHENTIILTVGLLLVAGICFEAGFLYGSKHKTEPIIVEKTAAIASTPCQQASAAATNVSADTKATSLPQPNNSPNIDPKNCPYVASKNSNKFHLATCQFAMKIKPENRICFTSMEDAQKRGYQGAKCCIK